MEESISFHHQDGTPFALIHEGCDGVIEVLRKERNQVEGVCNLCHKRGIYVPAPEIDPDTGEPVINPFTKQKVHKIIGYDAFFMLHNDYLTQVE